MKAITKAAAVLVFLCAGLALQAAPQDDLIRKAEGAYAQGNTADALTFLGSAQTAATDPAGKKALADSYASLGSREYEKRNFRNAYDFFKGAVKMNPTNQNASKRFWELKAEVDAGKVLRNEGDEAAAKKAQEAKALAAQTAASSAPAAQPVPVQAIPAQTAPAAEKRPAEESPLVKDTIAKLSKTEAELEKIKSSSSQTREENEKIKLELERQKKESEQQLESIRKASSSVAAESSALRAELDKQREVTDKERDKLKEALRLEMEKQRDLSDKEREKLREASLAAEKEANRLRLEMERQKDQLGSLKDNLRAVQTAPKQDTKALADLLNVVKESDSKRAAAEAEKTQVLAAELAEQRKLLAEQAKAGSGKNYIVLGAASGLALILVALIGFIIFAQARQRRAGKAEARPGAFPQLGLTESFAGAGEAGLGGHALVEFRPQSAGSTALEPRAREAGMYLDLLKAERIKTMHDQMRQGTLQWETVRDYIGYLETDLRSEILKVVETKIKEGDGVDLQSVLPVLYPFLTDEDDYVRDKAESLIRRGISSGVKRLSLLSPAEEISSSPDQGNLALNKLLEIPEKLKTALKDRDRSLATAKIVRGVAQILGFSQADGELIYKAAVAHDAGYLLLDQDRLRRIIAKKDLTAEEIDFIRSHTQKGLDYFKGEKLPAAFQEAILHHHERNDGTGYPDGLKGPEIPLFAKLIGLAETYAALREVRPYRERLSPEAALAVISDGNGRVFDREHVKALTELVRRIGDLT